MDHEVVDPQAGTGPTGADGIVGAQSSAGEPALRTSRGSGSFAALRHRDFRLFWGGQLISVVGTWMQSVGQSWLVLELTNSPTKLGLISALQFTPMLILAVFAGVWVDRLPKRKLIIVTQTILMLCAFVLFALTVTGVVRFWHIAVLAFVLGIAQAFDMPARQAFLVNLVGREDLMNAIALNSAMFNGARVVGPAIAGVVVAATGSAWAFFINGLSFLAVLVALLMMRAESLPRATTNRMLQEVKEGLRYARDTPVVFACLVTMLLVSLFAINPQVLIPLLARNVLHRGAQGYGFLMSASGVGALVGALFLARLSGGSGRGRSKAGVGARAAESRMGLVFGGGVALGLALIAGALVPSFAIAVPAVFAAGFSQIIFSASVNTNLQSDVPNHLRGRVMGLYALVFTGTTPFGSLLMGHWASGLGVRAAFALSGILGLLSAVGVWLVWRRWAKQGAEARTAADS